MTQTSINSHAIFIGTFNGKLTPNDIQHTNWEHVTTSDDDYNRICSQYYQGHVDAMLEREIDNLKKPEFLHAVSHYRLSLKDEKSCESGKRFTLQLDRRGNRFNYDLCLCNLHLYFFPLNIVFLAFEIDDSGAPLGDLTFAHGTLSAWKGLFIEKQDRQADEASSQNGKEYVNQDFLSFFESLKGFLPDKSLVNLLGTGNKFKIFQVIQVEKEMFKDESLYEIGTCSPIGCFGGDHSLAPSDDYYQMMMAENTASAFKNWKGLALMDTFTMLTYTEPNLYVWYHFYFPLIYLRCLFEKTYCFCRNTDYRMDKSVMDISKEISQMEKYYFYNSISYNFLPNLLYKAIAKGLELKEERKELSEQIKERAKAETERAKEEEAQIKEHEQRKSNRRLTFISIFAIFSIAWDLCSIVVEASSWDKQIVALVCLVVGVIAVFVFNTLIFRNKL